MKKYVFLCLILFSLSKSSLASRIDGKEVTFDDLIAVMMDESQDNFSPATIGSPVAYYSQHGFVIIQNCKIRFDRAKDNNWDKRFARNNQNKIVIKKGIDFNKCQFPDAYWFVLRDFVFEGPVAFRRCTDLQLYMRDCEFKNNFYVGGGEINFINFERCRFNLGFQLAENAIVKDHFTFESCYFTYDKKFYLKPRINPSQNIISNLHEKPNLFEIENRNNPFSLRILNTQLEVDSVCKDLSFSLQNVSLNNLELLHFSCNVPVNLALATITNQFNIRDFKIEDLLLVESISFNPSNSKIDWRYIAGKKIAIRNNKNKLVSGANINTSDEYDFNTLISVYALLYSSYKSQGNRTAANACYVEWKDVETEYFRYKMTQKDDFSVYFAWLMNTFLAFFCDYGTNPIKAILWSGYVIAFFALIYSFFQNTNNISNEIGFLNSLNRLSKYFTENKKFSECVFVKQKSTYSKTIERKLRADKRHLPLFFNWFASIITSQKILTYYKIKLVRKIDFYTGRWREASASKKRFIKVLYFLLLINIFVYVFLNKIFNALMLSLNVFSTLGFGNIPVTGFAKYLTVIEGFVGWFLLSIFSVSLISQIIQ